MQTRFVAYGSRPAAAFRCFRAVESCGTLGPATGVLICGGWDCKKLTHQRLHPGRHCWQTVFQIISDSRPVLWVPEDSLETHHDAVSIGREQVLQPVQGLHDTHGGAARPVETAGRRLLERNRLIAKLDRAEAVIGRHGHTGGNRRRKAKIVCCRYSIHDEAGLISSGDRIDHCARVRRSGSAGEFVEAGHIV